MDLCLKGSQINLATRQKTKPKPYSRSLTTLHNTAPHFRPRSANFIPQRSRSSPFLGRPQSADPRCGRRLSNYFSDKDFKPTKHRNISSTDLLKALLEEPIKRSWLCRSAGNSSTDEQSELSCPSLHKRTPDSCSSGEGEQPVERFLDNMPISSDKVNGFTLRTINWSGASKPDLPGRVSFSKSIMQNDIDSSDCDNDKQDLKSNSISAPGPLILPSFVHTVSGGSGGGGAGGAGSAKTEVNEQGVQKKSVHFGAPAAGSGEVLAETYEYPKCPSENCTCSTRSSSTASTHDAGDVKCACDAPACRYSQATQMELPKPQKSPTPELNVIREYKQAVNSQKSDNIDLPNYLGKFEKQNNLSDTKNQVVDTLTKKDPTTQRNFDAESNFLPMVQDDRRQYGSNSNTSNHINNSNNNNNNGSTDSVINNYLKVVASPPFSGPGKKKENLKPASAEVRTKSKVLSAGKLKKAVSVGSLREERKLNEYNMDKVDSWMSMHEQKQALDQFQRLHKQGLEDDSGSQLSMKSNEESRDSTYDEIVSVIKEIEEDKKQDNYAERLPSELNLKFDSRCDTAETISQPDTGDKYKDILTYLNNVESSCDKTLMETRRSLPDSNRSEVEFVVEPDVTDEVPKLSELLMLPNHQLARRVISLSLRANELANAIHLSKEHVLQLRAEKQKSLRSEKSSSATKLKDQKKHYEEVVKRHQGFIEQLLKDKGSLCEKVAALTRRLESQNQAWEHRLETELTRAKETTLAGEKIRRERWVRENTKKIKELTVKGLEAEINKMNCDHQREVTELKRTHQMQLLDALEEARVKHEQIEQSIRESCTQDREATIEKEVRTIRDRFQRQLEEEQKAHAEQKQKLCDEFAAERERLQAELRQKETDYQTKRQEAQRESDNDLEQAKFEMQEKMAKQEEKYQNRINAVEKQYLADFELWKSEHENNTKIAQAEKENAIRQHYRAERDRQLDELVERMEAEALQAGEENEQKLHRLREKYDKDVELAESVEKSLREKYAETRSKLAEADAQVRNCQAELKQLQLELAHSKKMCGDILSERDRLRENLGVEIQTEMAVLTERHKQEMEQLQKRVHQTIQRQEETIEVLKGDNDNLRQQCLKLSAVIRQQRKDYCVK